jgi:hypothetical protein
MADLAPKLLGNGTFSFTIILKRNIFREKKFQRETACSVCSVILQATGIFSPPMILLGNGVSLVPQYFTRLRKKWANSLNSSCARKYFVIGE